MAFLYKPLHNIEFMILKKVETMEYEEEVIIASAALDVPTDNYEEFDQEIDQSKFGEKLVQSNTLKGTVREYQLYAEKHLLLDFTEKKKQKKFRVNLACLTSEAEHYKVIVWKWLYAALAAGTSAGLFLYLALTDTIKLEYCIVAGTISITTAIILVLIFVYHMRNEFIFKSRYGNARLFLIENKKPAQQSFDQFFIHLQQRIDRAQTHMSVSERLVAELKMCRRLRDEGVIDDNAYTVARTAIFKHKQYKS